VLYKDTDADQELNASESIASLRLNSIMCAPLRAKNGILGILYVDSNRANIHYSKDDMLLVSAVGNSAGLALENAQMHQQILEKQRIEQEIATAWTIQEGFLVKDWPDSDGGFQIYGETRPAKTVGGDFYDFVEPEEGVVGMLIGDVSGKGVPAALSMAQLLASFRLFARDMASPAEVLRQLNETMVRRSQRGMFCTLCYLRLNLKDGTVVSANAGHSPVVRITADGAHTFCDASGPPVGILPDIEWDDLCTNVEEGDTLLLVTDGILEARGLNTRVDGSTPPDEYDIAGLEKITSQQYGKSPKALLDAVNDDVVKFCAPLAPHDDCTMVALRYLSHGNRH
jgi:serine phosphatase RsbU (regulator of sigma subunit)